MPWSYEAKLKVVVALIYPLGFYGSESAPCNAQEVYRLGVLVAKCVGPYAKYSSNLLTLLLCQRKASLVPAAVLLARKCALLRRVLAKHPGHLTSVSNIISFYAEIGLHGAGESESAVAFKEPCPPHGSGPREQWQPECSVIGGAVGLLCQGLHEHGASIDSSFEITAKGGPPFQPAELSFSACQALH